MKSYATVAVMACAAFLSTSVAAVGIEVFERNGVTVVREATHTLACTNCVHVGGSCLIGEGNCYSSEHASCTACGNKGSICVSDFGNCDNP
ncbi:hypothetical protein F5Y17DRAFT_80324 [Xylariaceae sp. FL0594]|nr:hypothetical protein F5Y17DRAFT_80324 [Xylariaceae sp. FL0594]